MKDDITKKRAAGVKKSAQKTLHHEKYLRVLKDNVRVMVTQSNIVSKKQRLYTVKQRKVGLSPIDIKRYILDNCIETLPYGHYSIRE